jgi:hypothetical protein
MFFPTSISGDFCNTKIAAPELSPARNFVHNFPKNSFYFSMMKRILMTHINGASSFSEALIFIYFIFFLFFLIVDLLWI